MKKFNIILIILTMISTAVSARADETTQPKTTANIKRIALEYLEHTVTNKDDPNYPDSYNSDEQTSVSGAFDGNITHEREKLIWVNGLTAKYGESKTTEDGETSKNENDDEIILYTDYTHKIWNLEQGIVGPFAYLGYETEFTEFELDGKDYRTKILRTKGGMKLYDGKYFKQLYIAAILEDDMTYNNDNMKSGAEIGYELSYPLNPTTNIVSQGYYRRFMSYTEKEPTDFKYRLKLDTRLEVKLTGDLYLAPFYTYELAETRGASKSRGQTTMGLSLSYAKSFDIFK